MNKITLLLLALSLSLFSCGDSKEQKDNELETTQPRKESLGGDDKLSPEKERSGDIELLRQYFDRQDSNITDENGFRVKYEVQQSWVDAVGIAQSDSLTFIDRGVSYTKFLKLLIGKSKFTLLKDDEVIKDITLIAQIYADVKITQVVHAGEDPRKPYTKEKYYFPELDDKSKRDNIIKELTSAYFVPDMGHNSAGLGDANDKLGMEYGNTIKESGIFQYTSLNDYTL